MSTARLHVTEERGRLHVRWVTDDPVRFGNILADWRAWWGRHGDACYCSTSKSWSLPLRARSRLEDWAEHWFLPDAQVWVEEPQEPEPPPRRPPPPGAGGGGPPATIAAAYAQLHLLPSAPPELVQAAHRILIKRAHPDAGGSHEAAVAVNRAWEILSGERSGRAS